MDECLLYVYICMYVCLYVQIHILYISCILRMYVLCICTYVRCVCMYCIGMNVFCMYVCMYVVEGSPILSRHHRRDSHSTNSDDTENSSNSKPNLIAIQTPLTARITALNKRMDFQQFVRLGTFSEYVRMYVCMHACMYVFMYVCIY